MKFNLFRNIVVFIFLTTTAFLILFYLRMIPAIGNTIEFRFDRSFNYRMTTNVIRSGDVPDIDYLSTYPEGKNIKAFLPTGMYHASALFYKSINRIKSITLSRSILLFCSVCGLLIFIPAYFISYEIYRNKITAFITAILAGIIPAYLHRSSCYWYRYEILGTPLLFMSLLFFIKGFSAQKARNAFFYSVLSAVFMVFALSVWRLSILFLIVYVIIFLYIWLKYEKHPKKWWIVFFTLLGISFIFLRFSHGFAGKNLACNYIVFPRAISQIFMHKLGITQNFTDFTRLVYHNRELGGVALTSFFNRMFFSFSGVFVFFYFIAYFKNKSVSIQKDILFMFLVFFLALTFIFLRNKIILGPLIAITMGESIDFALKSKKSLRRLLICVIAVLLIKTGYDSYKMISTRESNTKIRPYLKQVLSVINNRTPKNAVILCYWADGYPIQTYCNRPTITDGLFESQEIVNRIIAVSKIYYSYSEKELLDFCKIYGVTHILVPVNRKMVYSGYAGVKYRQYYRKKGPTSNGKLTTLYKLIYTPKELSKFHLLYKNKEFRFYRVEKI